MEQVEIEYLRSYGLCFALDLRKESEAGFRPSVFKYTDGIVYKNISLMNNADKRVYNEKTRLVDRYKHMLHERESMKEISSTLAGREDGTVIIHCSGGKDRTGIVSALLLLLAGVHDEDIAADYQISHTYLLPFFKDINSSELEYPLHLYYTEAEYMREFLDYLRECFVTVDVYMDYLGVERKEVEILRRKILGSYI